MFQKLLFRLRLLARGSPTKAVAQKQSTAGIRIDSLQGSPSPAKDAGGQRSFAAASPSAKETKKDEERKSKEERASPPDQRVKASPARREGSPQGGDRTPPKTAGASLSSPATSMGTAQSPQSRAMSETRASTRRKPLYEWETRESRAYDDRVSPWSTETGRTKVRDAFCVEREPISAAAGRDLITPLGCLSDPQSRASSSDGQGKWFLEDANHVDMVLELTPEEYSELKVRRLRLRSVSRWAMASCAHHSRLQARRSLRTHQQRLEKARSVRQSTFSLFG